MNNFWSWSGSGARNFQYSVPLGQWTKLHISHHSSKETLGGNSLMLSRKFHKVTQSQSQMSFWIQRFKSWIKEGMFSLGRGAQCQAAAFASVGILVIKSSVLKIVKKQQSITFVSERLRGAEFTEWGLHFAVSKKKSLKLKEKNVQWSLCMLETNLKPGMCRNVEFLVKILDFSLEFISEWLQFKAEHHHSAEPERHL